MTKKRYSPHRLTGSQAMATRDSDYGSFEVLVDDQEQMKPSRPSSDSPGPRRWIAAVSILALLAVGGTGLAAVFGGEDDDREAEEIADDEATGFQPYGGGTVPTAEDDDGADDDEASVATARVDREPSESDSSPDDERLIEQVDNRHPDRDRNLDEFAPDGREILEDTRGNSMSQREAQNRIEKQLDSIDNADHEFEARLRRRDMQLNSRVIQPAVDGRGIEIAPGVELSEDVQARLREQYAPRRGEDFDDTQGVDEDRYEGAQPDGFDDYDDDFYDDEYVD